MQRADRFLIAVLASVRRDLAEIVIGAVGTAAASLALAVLAGRAAGHLDGNDSARWWIVLGLVALGLAEYTASAWQQIRAATASSAVLTTLRSDLVDAVHREGEHLGAHGHEAWVVGLGLIEAEHLNVLIVLFGQFVGSAFASLLAIVVAATLSIWLAVTIAVATTFAVTVGAGSWAAMATESNHHYAATQDITSLMSTVLDGRDTILGLGIESSLRAHARQQCEHAVTTGTRFARAMARADASGQVIGVAALAGLVVVIAQAAGSGPWTAATAVTAVALIGSLIPQTSMLALAVGRISTARAGAERLLTVLATAPPSAAAASTATDDSAQEPALTRPGSVVLDQVSVTDPNRPDRLLLDSFSLTVEPGSLVVLCGPAGAGKSLVLQLIRGSIAPTHGTVRLDGKNPFHLTAEQRRATVAASEQHPFLYDDTLYANLAIASVEAGRTERGLLHAAGEQLQDILGARTLGRRGRDISGGQRRRIVVARALTLGAPIVTLDDPTMSLDHFTEETFAARVATLRGSTTVVAATNSPALASRADLVIVLDGGLQIDRGTDAELRRSSSRFRELIGGRAVEDGERQ